MTKITKKSILLIIVLLSVNFIFAQEENKEKDGKTIEIIHSNSMEYDESIVADANRLLGEVVFTHDDAFMFCDSAYFFQSDNRMVAYGDVKITRGDTLLIICKELQYNGNEKKAEMKDSVVLKHYHSYLITNFLRL